MGRKALGVGHYGHIRTAELAKNKWTATATIRDSLTVTTRVSAQGTSPSDAKRALKDKFEERKAANEARAKRSIEQAEEESRAAEDAKRARDRRSFSYVAHRWLKASQGEGLAVSSRVRYGDLLRLHLEPAFGDDDIRDIGIVQLDDFLQEFVERGQISQARSLRSLLMNVFGYAHKKQFVPFNPARATDSIKPKTSTPTALRAAELESIRDAVGRYMRPEPGRGGPTPSVPVDLIIDTMLGGGGLRIGEALALRWTDLDIEGEEPTLRVLGTTVEVRNDQNNGTGLHRQSRTKTKSSMRAVRMPEWLRTRLAEAPRNPQSDLVFCTKSGKPLSRSNVYRALKKALDDAGIEHFVLHDLRKTVATAVDKYEGLAAASSILGHSNTVITQASYVERAELKADVRTTLDAFAPRQ